MKSTWNYPIFQRQRDELATQPFVYRMQAIRNSYRIEDWRERGYDLKHKAMVAQKREPVFWAGPAFHKSIGSTWAAMDVK